MSEMIERVAIAIDKAVAAWQPGSCLGSIKLMAARAAIEAMREPTNSMIVQGDYAIWRDMIDDALTNGDGGVDHG